LHSLGKLVVFVKKLKHAKTKSERNAVYLH
jgi:hypothetical protein